MLRGQVTSNASQQAPLTTTCGVGSFRRRRGSRAARLSGRLDLSEMHPPDRVEQLDPRALRLHGVQMRSGGLVLWPHEIVCGPVERLLDLVHVLDRVRRGRFAWPLRVHARARRPSLPTGTTTAPSSRPPSARGCACCARPTKANTNGPARTCPGPAPDHRIDQPDLQRPARPRTARRAHARRSDGASSPAHPGNDLSDMAQRPHRCAGLALTDRLRLLTFA